MSPQDRLSLESYALRGSNDAHVMLAARGQQAYEEVDQSVHPVEEAL